MRNKALIVLILSLGMSSKAYSWDVFCGFSDWPPQFPNATQVHVTDWTSSDEFLYNFIDHFTSMVPPMGVTLTNNPRTTTFVPSSEPVDSYAHGVAPTPIPPGVYIIVGSTKLESRRTFMGFPITFPHPDSPMSCNSSDSTIQNQIRRKKARCIRALFSNL